MDLLVDDERTFCELIARTPEAGIYILTRIHIKTFYLDFDLTSSKSGLDFLKEIHKTDDIPRNIPLVTMNPVGRKAMGMHLKDLGYKTTDEINFKKEI